MSFIAELKRRNVFKVGVAYVVAAWLLLQLTEVLTGLLELQADIGKIVIILLVIGFPVALFFAWAFELTPDGVKRETEVNRSQSLTANTGKTLNNAILALMTLAIAYLLFDKFYGVPQLDATTGVAEVAQHELSLEMPPKQASEAAMSRQSIAVLPFDNRSKLEDDAFFVEGIHDDLLTNLARISQLKVISRTSVTRYKNTEKSIPEIASELGVATIMEGAVQRAGNTVRINVQLIDAETDEHLWAEIFDRELTADNLFAIQTEISTEIANALSATLSPEEQRRVSDRPTENLQAYSAYLKGRQLMTRLTSSTLEAAELEFQRSVQLDPSFALAWTGLAETALLQVGYGSKDVVLARAQRQEAVDIALQLNDQLGEAHLSLATLHYDAYRLSEAEAAFKRAIELSPGYATAYEWYGGFLADQPHRIADAGEMLEKALELDPMSSVIRTRIGGHLIQLGQFEKAEATVKEVLRLDPGFVLAFNALAGIAYERGQFDEMLKWQARVVEIDPGSINAWVSLAWPYLHLAEIAPLAKLRQRVESIDDQNAALGWVDAYSNMYQDRNLATIEDLDWIYKKTGGDPFMYRIKGYLYNFMRDYARVRTAWEISDPEYFDRARWREGVEDEADFACLVGDVLRRTGDEDKGLALLQLATAFLEDELPQYVDHADRYKIENCYLALGQTEKAIEAIERRVDHGHGFAWFFMLKDPLYEALWGTPRFEAVMQQVELQLVGQRERAVEITRELGL